MAVKWENIRTIGDLFATTKYRIPSVERTFNPSLLSKISLWHGDITTIEADAIVNAANTSLRGGGGVDGAIHRAAGPQLKHECITRFPEGTETGTAILTKGYNLPAKNVIHTVGPKYYEYESRVERAQELLSSCYRRSLSLAHANGLTSIAFPAISTGVYGYPLEEASKIALEQTRSFLETPEGQNFQRVIFVVFSEEDLAVFQGVLPRYFPPSPSDTVSDVANP